MSDTELQHLVDMVNDIARNFEVYPDTEDRIADHLSRFWAPSMKSIIREHVGSGGQGMSDAAMEAVRRLPT